MKKAQAYILLGGFFGPDGWIVSAPFLILRSMLLDIGIPVKTYTWDQYAAARDDIAGLPSDTLVMCFGFSGGASRLTYLANDLLNSPAKHKTIDLAVFYDPSPSWQMNIPIGVNVRRAITYHNKAPFFFGYGGGVLLGRPPLPKIEVVDIAENHMLVQSDSNLHQQTISAVRALLA